MVDGHCLPLMVNKWMELHSSDANSDQSWQTSSKDHCHTAYPDTVRILGRPLTMEIQVGFIKFCGADFDFINRLYSVKANVLDSPNLKEIRLCTTCKCFFLSIIWLEDYNAFTEYWSTWWNMFRRSHWSILKPPRRNIMKQLIKLFTAGASAEISCRLISCPNLRQTTDIWEMYCKTNITRKKPSTLRSEYTTPCGSLVCKHEIHQLGENIRRRFQYTMPHWTLNPTQTESWFTESKESEQSCHTHLVQPAKSTAQRSSMAWRHARRNHAR